MIEFQLTVYMCSHCTRVHNAAHECLQHERTEHLPSTVQPIPLTIPPQLQIVENEPPMTEVAQPSIVLKRDHECDDHEEETDTSKALEPPRKTVKIEQNENLPVESLKLTEAVGLADIQESTSSAPLSENNQPSTERQTTIQPTYKCQTCRADFTDLQHYVYHTTGMATKDKGNSNWRYRRVICQLYASNGRQNLTGGPVGNDQRYYCVVCLFQSKKRYSYERHLLGKPHNEKMARFLNNV